ncbi:hypothetical protein JBL43_19880 [Aureibaculum sp. A20]|uniref:Uncharacterized protein n=1 Tax=Aureibaculum flavum TaxID=2795986 RepID=A0ABS0WX07_9FLAO|nr:hypothetical protein [Aureibaculum flavum]MBJ2176518.1 hypothetical protein [Aureibaculum flavum]
MTKIEKIEQILKTVEIHEKIVRKSTEIDNETKPYFLELSKFTKDCLTNESKVSKLNSYQIKSLENELLIYWNETISVETEKFWTEILSKKINIQRKEPLKFALDKKRFRNVEQGIGARKYWSELKTINSVKDNFSKTEIVKIDQIITEDENKRIGILEKCLTKKVIPKSQYLKFGECMAYITNCELFSKYMTEKDVDELHEIWRNFKS